MLMKQAVLLILIGICFSLSSCGKKDPNAVAYQLISQLEVKKDHFLRNNSM
jgi:hypothetical protein